MFLPYHYPQVVRKVRHPRSLVVPACAGMAITTKPCYKSSHFRLFFLLALISKNHRRPRAGGNNEGAGMTCEEAKVNI
ncbi:hypothetical protein CbuQ229_02740 [Coxiella burnetii]|nr:hypothetical protein CbuQ229_02740 [Coxiella burnetii]